MASVTCPACGEDLPCPENKEVTKLACTCGTIVILFRIRGNWEVTKGEETSVAGHLPEKKELKEDLECSECGDSIEDDFSVVGFSKQSRIVCMDCASKDAVISGLEDTPSFF